tara:strand:+ start:78348 stop:80258 length:1911 start_codon:yes stop_codon:yes gene_type:complete
MPVLTLENIHLSIGETPLFDNIQLNIQPRDKIALVGRNGAGKSTLLRIMAGLELPDAGSIKSEHKIALLNQSLPTQDNQTTFEYVSSGLQDIGKLLQHYHHLTHDTPAEQQDDAWLSQLQHVQQDIDAQNGWDIQHRIEKIMTELDLPEDKLLKELSGGWRRRLDLAKTLINEPDLLLLDEPTNHLDIAAIRWLETYLLSYPKAIVFITHDRALLKNLANHIIEIDRGQLYNYTCDYSTYLQRKAKREEDEETALKKLDQKLSEEEAWLRQGVKARRKRNQGRLRDLISLRDTRQSYQGQQQKPTFEANQVARSNKIVLEADKISFAYPDQPPIIKDFSFVLQRKEKIAIIGPNGSGKTTLINLLMGLLPLSAGKLHHSPNNQIAYFDQKRDTLRPECSLIDNVTEGDDFIEINGKRKHIVGYLGDFLFSPKKAHAKARSLSGGEQNRLLLAKLFAKPANILILDEPTNDLDLESLELLESLLLEYTGTVLIISHDREFIDNVATHYIAYKQDGQLETGVGGYSDWRQRETHLEKKEAIGTPVETKMNENKPPVQASQPVLKSAQTKKLNYNEQRELKALPLKIEQLESELEILQKTMQQSDFYQKSQNEIKPIHDKFNEIQSTLEQYYARWEELE